MNKRFSLLATLVVFGTLLFASQALASNSSYSNVPSWNGTDVATTWGPAGTQTYGETIPGNGEELSSFTFYLDVNPNIVFRAVVGTWDGHKVGSSLWSSSDMTSGGTNGTLAPVTVTLPQGITLALGQQYVIFFTIDFSTQPGSVTPSDGQWGAIPTSPTDSFPQGGYVYQNSANPANLFATNWTTTGYASSRDLVFTAQFGQPVSPSVDSVNSCANGNAYRAGDGSFGSFLTIAESEFNTGNYTDALGANWTVTPANFVKGVGATCDNPQNAGYVYSGYNVSADGTVDVAAPQFNIYPYWIPASKL